MNNFNEIAEKFVNSKVLLVGDIMLDEYIKGEVNRISPEGPIPVLRVSSKNNVLGGAGNVFANLCALGCQTQIMSVIGNDEAGKEIENKINALSSDGNLLLKFDDRSTTIKTRLVTSSQQLLRVDAEDNTTIDKLTENHIIESIEEIIDDIDVIILSDYGKEVITERLAYKLIKLANKKKTPIIVDPKGKDYSKYKNATIITPNRKELSESTGGMAVKTDEEILAAGNTLIKECKFDHVLATRSEDGISTISKKGDPIHYPTQSLEVYDVSGAGDTVVAVAAACIVAGEDLSIAAQVANAAGAIVVSKMGTAVVTPAEIAKYFDDKNEKEHVLKATSWEDAKDQIAKWQAKGLQVGFTNGCFDIVHYGHVNYLANAKEKCDRMIVGLNHDKSVKILKGESRPINDENARAAVIAALASTDMVVLFGAETPDQDNTPSEVVGYLQPDIFMKGGDYTLDQLPEGKVVVSYGGKVEIMPLYDGYSTTNIIKKSSAQ
ncbi:MAG: D-glycero-beta-D-manno-heptose-7-phosphate kinase [Pseudomonadota bacterium]